MQGSGLLLNVTELSLTGRLQEGRTLFAVTAAGAVRSYRLPLNGDYSEVRTHGAPIAGVGLMYDDSLLFTVGEDCSLFVFDVQHDVKSGSRRELEKLPFADEVMVTKIDLEEKRSRYVAHHHYPFLAFLHVPLLETAIFPCYVARVVRTIPTSIHTAGIKNWKPSTMSKYVRIKSQSISRILKPVRRSRNCLKSLHWRVRRTGNATSCYNSKRWRLRWNSTSA